MELNGNMDIMKNAKVVDLKTNILSAALSTQTSMIF